MRTWLWLILGLVVVGAGACGEDEGSEGRARTEEDAGEDTKADVSDREYCASLCPEGTAFLDGEEDKRACYLKNSSTYANEGGQAAGVCLDNGGAIFDIPFCLGKCELPEPCMCGIRFDPMIGCALPVDGMCL